MTDIVIMCSQKSLKQGVRVNACSFCQLGSFCSREAFKEFHLKCFLAVDSWSEGLTHGFMCLFPSLAKRINEKPDLKQNNKPQLESTSGIYCV